MKDNGPVTQREYLVGDGQILVSVTDLKGRIVYCNPAFAVTSGYSEAELLGQSHNIVRHPDMPERPSGTCGPRSSLNGRGQRW